MQLQMSKRRSYRIVLQFRSKYQSRAHPLYTDAFHWQHTLSRHQHRSQDHLCFGNCFQLSMLFHQLSSSGYKQQHLLIGRNPPHHLAYYFRNDIHRRHSIQPLLQKKFSQYWASLKIHIRTKMYYCLPGVEVHTASLSQFPPVPQQMSVNSSSIVQSLIPFAAHSVSASAYVTRSLESLQLLTVSQSVEPAASVEQQRTKAVDDSD